MKYVATLVGIVVILSAGAAAKEVRSDDRQKNSVAKQVSNLPYSIHSAVIERRHHASPSPDGKFIVYHAHVPVLDQFGAAVMGEGGYPATKTQLYISNVDRQNERALFESDMIHAQEPRWSPDGKWIAFVGGPGYELGDHKLYLIRPDGTDMTELADSQDALIKSPAWAADSQRIAFSVIHRNSAHIDIIGVNGGERKHLTDEHDGYHDHPRWSPSGERMLISWTNAMDGENTQSGIYVLDPDDPDEIQWLIEPGSSEERFATWANEHSLIFGTFDGAEEAARDLFYINLQTMEQRNITSTPHRWEYFPYVSRDGLMLYYDEGFVGAEEGAPMVFRIVARPFDEVVTIPAVGGSSLPPPEQQ